MGSVGGSLDIIIRFESRTVFYNIGHNDGMQTGG